MRLAIILENNIEIKFEGEGKEVRQAISLMTLTNTKTVGIYVTTKEGREEAFWNMRELREWFNLED